MRTFLIAAIAAALPLGAYATGTFQGKETGQIDHITGTIEGTTYNGSIYLTNNDQRIEVALGNPSLTMRRGLPFAALAIGKTVTVDAYDSASDGSDRLYAQRIVIDGRIINLKT